ncbi:hypothetical protein HPB50_017458 [Hyalomma asiaticum]|uniref:Uncharacterized protein n=1 Tax=Hyalomma asiaticum TaxID=266040 RepID=A0ACB7RLA7_HYAAI|nr:hypothetical protein HPB50_017458 [Hyalomma asiaticum]
MVDGPLTLDGPDADEVLGPAISETLGVALDGTDSEHALDPAISETLGAFAAPGTRSVSDSGRVAVDSTDPLLQASTQDLDELASEAKRIQADILASRAYRPPPPASQALEPRCAWNGDNFRTRPQGNGLLAFSDERSSSGWKLSDRALDPYTYARRAACAADGRVVLDPTGLSKGFGFVRFSDGTEYQEALVDMQNSLLVGSKPIRVGVANPRRAAAGPGGQRVFYRNQSSDYY